MRSAPFLALLGLASGLVLPRQDGAPPAAVSPTSSVAQLQPTPNVAAAKGTCSNPLQRKEWRQLSVEDRLSYINAVKCLQNTAPKAKYNSTAIHNILDDMTYTHNELASDIHFVASFLPWHRWILARHERLLREMCGYTGAQPYWDWTIDAMNGDVAGSEIFDPKTGFGGDGKDTGSIKPGYVNCVDGPFSNLTLTLGMGYPKQEERGNQPHCLTRHFNDGSTSFWRSSDVGDMRSGTYNAATMNAIHRLETYVQFSSALERQPHGQVHNAIGGDMSPTTAPNDPIFYLHHANVDRHWAKWQGRNATRLADFSGNKDQRGIVRAAKSDPMPIMQIGEGPIVADYLDTMNGPLCYEYSESEY